MLNDTNSALYKFSLEETISGEFPRLELHIGLRDEFLTTHPLTDGSPIYVEIGNENQSNAIEVCRFRLYTFDAMSSPLGGTLEYQIVAYHEALWYLSKIEDESYTMTSEGVFNRIAERTNLLADTDKTNDPMTWFTLEGNRLDFLRSVCAHAWANKYSVYAWWVNRTGVLNFKNLVERIQQKASRRIIETTDITGDLNIGVTPVSNVTYAMESAINNFRYGYGNNTLFYDVENVRNRLIYPREFKSNAESLNISKVGQNQGWISYGISEGNTHSNYQRAEIQNKRGLALWSTVVTCVDQYCFDVSLGDCVEFLFKVDGKDDALLYSGNYLVSGINLVLDTTNKPVKKLFLVRQGISVPVFDETSDEQPTKNTQYDQNVAPKVG